jgi:hypothetical protein
MVSMIVVSCLVMIPRAIGLSSIRSQVSLNCPSQISYNIKSVFCAYCLQRENRYQLGQSSIARVVIKTYDLN